MDLVLWLVMGLIAGVLAMIAVFKSIPRRPESWIVALGAGLLGGWLGGWIGDRIDLTASGPIASLLIAFLGAYVILWFMRRAVPRASN